jgi:3-phenylpropionate/trans-cinnamate dioxygenase ferredoxin reductase component
MTAGTGTKPVVIIDGGQSGGIAAATLREEGFGRPVLIVSGEPGIPFGKPPLSKTYLRSEVGLDGWYVRPVDWYAAQDVAVLTGSVVTGNDPATHRVLLRSGRELEYQKALIATGARNRRLQIGGAELPASTTCGRWPRPTRSRPKPASDAAPSWWAWGFIGCEVAASLTQLGVQVSAVYPSKNPLERVLGEQIGTLIAAIHRSHGVRLLAGDGVAAFEGEERLTGVVTTNGERIGCDFAVGGVGVEPDAPAASGSSVAQQNGILVDEQCRTSAADVYAAGDVANHPHPVLGRVRVEHFNSATHHGAAAARSMLGSPASFDYIHNFWTDQYEHTLQYVGHATTWDDVAVRGSLDERRAVVFYLLGWVARAALGFDRGTDPEYEPDSDMAACAQLVARRARPERAALPRADGPAVADPVSRPPRAAPRRAGRTWPGWCSRRRPAGRLRAACRERRCRASARRRRGGPRHRHGRASGRDSSRPTCRETVRSPRSTSRYSAGRISFRTRSPVIPHSARASPGRRGLNRTAGRAGRRGRPMRRRTEPPRRPPA